MVPEVATIDPTTVSVFAVVTAQSIDEVEPPMIHL